jgi:hypothetical protein
VLAVLLAHAVQRLNVVPRPSQLHSPIVLEAMRVQFPTPPG